MMTLLEHFEAISARVEIPGFLKAQGMNRTICEVGVRYGYHFRQLLACDPELAIGVDLWRDDGIESHNDTGLNQEELDIVWQKVFHAFLYDSRCKFFRGLSVKAACCIDDLSLDFCYIDADHTYEGCRDDLFRWWKKVRQGGMLAGHDHVTDDAAVGIPFGVIRAVKEFRDAKKIEDKHFRITECGYRTWMILRMEGE